MLPSRNASQRLQRRRRPPNGRRSVGSRLSASTFAVPSPRLHADDRRAPAATTGPCHIGAGVRSRPRFRARHSPVAGSGALPLARDVDSSSRLSRGAGTGRTGDTPCGRAGADPVVDREREIPPALRRARDREIAEQLVLSPHTVTATSRTSVVSSAAPHGLPPSRRPHDSDCCEMAERGHLRNDGRFERCAYDATFVLSRHDRNRESNQ